MITYEKFLNYHNNNPKVYSMFERFSLQAAEAGWRNFGVGAIAERMRWETVIVSRGDEFKINNSYRAFYARMFEENHPQYKGFFRKRRSVADQKGFF